MNELRQRLLEAAEAAAREGQIPSAAVVVQRGRRRRLRMAGTTAVLIILAVVAGIVGAGWLTDRPPPLTPTPTTRPTPGIAPTSTTGPTSTTAPTRPWIPSVTPLNVKAQPGPYPGPDPGNIVGDATSMVTGCQGKSRIRLWIRTQKKVWLISAKPTPPGQQRVCWSHAFMNQGGGGGLSLGTPQPVKPLTALAEGGGDGHNRLGVVGGTVSKQAVRVRVMFHKGPPLEVVPVDPGPGFPINFFAGFYLEAGPPPTEGQNRIAAVDRVIAIDRAGNQIAACRLSYGLGNTC
jgi:hypothetical protein